MFPASEPLVLIAPLRSPSGLLWTGAAPAGPEEGGVLAIELAECWADDGRTGRLRVLPGASEAPVKVFLEVERSASPLMSRRWEEREETG